MNKPEPKYPNSAGRLLAILEAIQSGKPVAQQLVPILFGEEAPSNEKDISLQGVKAVTELHTLYATFLQDLADSNMSDEERTVLEKGLSSLENLLYPLALNQGLREVSEAEKALLEVCATRLPKENIIDETDFQNIKESIQSLRTAISELDNHPILKNILLELARLSEDSINRFNIYGAEGLKKAFKNMLAEVAEVYLQDDEDIVEIKENPAWDKAVKHLKLFDSVAAKAMKYRPLIEKASQYFIGN